MHNPVEALRNRKLDTIAKTLRENGLEDGDGDLTMAGFKVLINELWADKREGIAKLLTELEAETAKQ